LSRRLSGALETVSLFAIVGFDFVVKFSERGLDGLDEVQATGSYAAQGDDGVALREIIRDNEHFAVTAEAMGGAFDKVIGGLARAGVKDFHFGRGFDGGEADVSVGAVENNGYGGADGVAIERETVDEFVASGGGVARFARSQFRPVMQQAVAVNEYAHQSHEANHQIKNSKCKIKKRPKRTNLKWQLKFDVLGRSN
jgi:hypothetical protein